MVEASQRAAYLHALGIDQWQPRAQPQAATLIASPVPPQQSVSEEPVETSTGEAESAFIPVRDLLQDERVNALLEQAAINWSSSPQLETKLAVLGIDARDSLLTEAVFDQDQDTLHKMLSAIGCDLNQCALGGMHWQSLSSRLVAPNILVLVDSGEDHAALIHYWRDKTLQSQGSTIVIAPHPRMFSQGTSVKRQAWQSLQLLQKNWVA